MATVSSRPVRTVIGNKRLVTAEVTLSNSYTTGGEAVSAALLGLASVDSVVGVVSVAGTRYPTWDPTNKKLKMHSAVGTEVTNATDLSGEKVRVTAIGV